MTINPEIAEAIDEIKADFPDATITVKAEADGSAWVTVDAVDLGDRWEPTQTWIGFRIADGYPYADTYPHFIDAGVHLADGEHPAGVTAGHTYSPDGRPCLQVSRRSNRLDPIVDTASMKLVKVSHWLSTR